MTTEQTRKSVIDAILEGERELADRLLDRTRRYRRIDQQAV
ncbi:MAG: hypothetical protein WCL71_18110 [Deltaproteobacteria bacterium]